MHKQQPQTAYRKDAVLIGTIFENCDTMSPRDPMKIWGMAYQPVESIEAILDAARL